MIIVVAPLAIAFLFATLTIFIIKRSTRRKEDKTGRGTSKK